MKINLTNRSASALLLLAIIYFCTVSASVFASGIKDRPVEPVRPMIRNLVWIEPSVKPDWVDVVPQNNTEIFFVGTSQIFSTPANARDNARESARIQVLEYYGQVIEKQAIALSAVSGSARDTLAPFIIREDAIRVFAQNVVSEVATVAYYTEMYLNSNNKEEYIVYTLHQINRQKAEDEIVGFAKNISERYTASFPQWKTLKAALEGYAFIAKSLEQNPLHRIMAYIDTQTGRAGLYEYVRMQINELSNSVSIETIPARTIKETENLITKINLRSSIMPATGALDCQASIFGISSDDIIFPFKTASDDPYNLYIRNIRAGSYIVFIEILLADLTGGIAKNTSGSFSFEVTPLNITLDTPAAIEAGIKRTIDSLADALQTQTDTIIGSFTMTGTDIPSELSVYLTEKVTHYAKNNKERKYRVMGNDAEQTAVLSGFFTRRNDRVDVTIELTTPDRNMDGSHIFSISADVLENAIGLAIEVDVLENTIGLAIEPENINNLIVLDEVIPVSETQDIHIEASLNSKDRTYKHRDELTMSVIADHDCFFKIIHINVDNQIRMIFPAKNDNNFLSANVSRAVFGNQNSRYMIYGPYGAETLVVVASPVQFPNIEREYNEPWKDATEANIIAAIAGSGEARYPITILKPHEEYEFSRPENMTETFQSIRDDVMRQNGYLEGNATSGFYIVNNVRGSYRVPGDNPNVIQFATYFLDTYTADSYRGVRTRGSSFNFSFEKPQNISHAVRMVQTSITKNGGTFSGNDQQGDFRASGITGKYRVTDVVSVTISEKPVIIPNSLIVNEVKNFFGVR